MVGMNGPVLLSVVIPVWNRTVEIGRAVCSVAGQLAGRAAEIIVVDDASTDGTGEALARLKEQWPIVRTFRLPVHKGAAVARNAGLDMARGRYVWFVDSDDVVLDGALELIWPELQDPCLDVLRFDKQNGYPGCVSIASKRPPPALRFDFRKDLVGLLSCLSMGSLWNAVFSRRSIGNVRFDEAFSFGEDAPFVWAVVLGSRQCVHLRVPLYAYMDTPGSLTSSKTADRFRCYMRQTECFLRLVRESDHDVQTKRALCEECEWRVYAHAFGCFEPREITGEMWRAWRESYATVMVKDKRRTRGQRLVSLVLSKVATKHVAHAIFRHLLQTRRKRGKNKNEADSGH